jgi:hypothetical protein
MTAFVVINESGQPIEVRYKVEKVTLGPLNVAGIPVIVEASELTGKGGQDWKPLTSSQLQVDNERSTVTVQVPPGGALRVANLNEYGGHKDPAEANHFPIEEIEVTGSNGRVVVTGPQTRLVYRCNYYFGISESIRQQISP